MAKTSTAIDRIQEHLKDPAVRPGTPARFTEACTINDGIPQGDLNIKIVATVPNGYTKAKTPTAQLVPGNTQGSKHCLDSLDGVTIYLPKTWGQDPDSLDGPCLVLTEERTILHPTHGAVTIPAGFTVLCRYQREWAKEEAKQRRARD